MDFPPYHFCFSFVHTIATISVSFGFTSFFASSLGVDGVCMVCCVFFSLSLSSGFSVNHLDCAALHSTTPIRFIMHASVRRALVLVLHVNSESPMQKWYSFYFITCAIAHGTARHPILERCSPILDVNVTCCHNCHGAALIALYALPAVALCVSTESSKSCTQRTEQPPWALAGSV